MLMPRIVVVVVCFMMLSAPTVAVADQDAENLDAQILDLQTKRVEVLKRVVMLYTIQYREGSIDIRPVVAAELELTDAILATANTADKRIGLLEEQLQIATSFENLVTVRFRDGGVTEADVQEARATRLRIHIKLLQERRQELAAKC